MTTVCAAALSAWLLAREGQMSGIVISGFQQVHHCRLAANQARLSLKRSLCHPKLMTGKGTFPEGTLSLENRITKGFHREPAALY